MHERVNSRVEWMFQAGLLDEVRQLISKHGQLGRTASQAVGYKEPLEYLNGGLEYSKMVDQVKAHTRQFVRRQEIWFRSMPSLQRLSIDNESEMAEIGEQIAENCSTSS